jgi:hypothetical protein
MVVSGCHIRRAIRNAYRGDAPYVHWIPRDVLPVEVARELVSLPFAVPEIADTAGRRETHNSSRVFFSEENRARHPVCDAVAACFQDDATVALLEDVCGRSLGGSYLRIENCLDTDGFWLEPHTDIGAKLFTMLIYLSDHPDAVTWGTDIYDAQGALLERSPGTFNTGLIFLPASNTWHGFAKRPIAGVRRSLIVNYVKPEWRSRHELAFPAQPVVGVI